MKAIKIKNTLLMVSLTVLFFTACTKDPVALTVKDKPTANDTENYYVLNGDTIGGNGGGFQLGK